MCTPSDKSAIRNQFEKFIAWQELSFPCKSVCTVSRIGAYRYFVELIFCHHNRVRLSILLLSKMKTILFLAFSIIAATTFGPVIKKCDLTPITIVSEHLKEATQSEVRD